MRRVLLGGVIGAAPGALFLLVVFILETTDVITSDQSQIGFIALPILFLGTLIGVAFGASGHPHGGMIATGALLGVVGGIALGIVIDRALHSAGTEVAGVWLMLGLVGMIGGAALGAWWGERQAGPPDEAHLGPA